MSSAIRVAVAGATGKTGGAVADGLVADWRTANERVASERVKGERAGVQLANGGRAADDRARDDRAGEGADVGERPIEVVYRADSSHPLSQAPEFDVLVDFTNAQVARDDIELALARNAHVVLGTTGLDGAWLADVGERFAAAGLGIVYAPNFALGMVLAMQLAEQVARTIPDATVEIVETHNPAKLDAPSGTAKLTAERIGVARGDRSDIASDDPARGEMISYVPVHSLRLTGAVAHQEVVFGLAGQLLTIRHDAIDRSCYVPGVALAVRRVSDTRGLTVGLERLLGDTAQ